MPIYVHEPTRLTTLEIEMSLSSQQPKTWLHAVAETQGIPLRALDMVRTDLAHAKWLKPGTDITMARIMLRHGRLTDEARNYVAREYPQ